MWNACDKFLIGMMIRSGFTLSMETDPMKIIRSRNKTLGTDAKQTGFYLLNLDGIFFFLRKNAYIVGGIVTLGLLVSLLFIHKADAIQDRKRDIEHKLGILFLISSAITLFDIMKRVFDTFL